MLTMRKVAAAVAVTVIAVGVGLIAHPTPVSAHGAQIFPGSRQYFCWLDGLRENGEIIPANPACADAVAQSGTTPLYNWFGNLHPSAAGRTTGFIPDGRICDGNGGGPYDFEPYNMMRDDWPLTHLTAGVTYQFRHNNWAAHPGRFDVYLTRQGWDPSAPLSWDDLELIDTAVNPPQTGPPGALEYYFWDTTFPDNRSGRHLVFTHWVRSDSPENFYSCSDIVFDGGNGEVTGLRGQPPDPEEPPGTPGAPSVSNVSATRATLSWGASSGGVTAYDVVNVVGGTEQVLATVSGGQPPPTSTTVTGLTPETHYEVAVRARNGTTGEVSALSPAVAFDTPGEEEPPPGECTVNYRVFSQWTPGFHAEVTVTNDSATGIDGWEVTWSFADGQQITQLWGGLVDQSGAAVSVTNETWNRTIAANGGRVVFGFLANWSGANRAPTAFTLNGTACTVT